MFYESLGSTASALIGSKGLAATLIKVTEGAYDPATSSSAPATVSLAANVAVFDYKDRDIDGERVQRGDRRVLMSPDVQQAPEVGDKVNIQSVVYQVIDVITVSPGGIPVLYKIQVRK